MHGPSKCREEMAKQNVSGESEVREVRKKRESIERALREARENSANEKTLQSYGYLICHPSPSPSTSTGTFFFRLALLLLLLPGGIFRLCCSLWRQRMPHMTNTKPGIDIVAGPDTSHDTRFLPSPLSKTQFSLFGGFLLNSKTDGAKIGLWVGSWGNATMSWLPQQRSSQLDRF